MDSILDIGDAAEYLHIKKWTLYRLAKKGRIPGVKVFPTGANFFLFELPGQPRVVLMRLTHGLSRAAVRDTRRVGNKHESQGIEASHRHPARRCRALHRAPRR